MNFTFNIEKGKFNIVEREKIERSLKGKSTIDLLNDYIVFDIETTGLDSTYDEIIEIGAIKVHNNTIISIFNSLVKPQNEIDEYITKLTGITNKMVKDAPTIEEILPDFMIGELCTSGGQSTSSFLNTLIRYSGISSFVSSE